MSIRVVLPYDSTWQPLRWAKDYCPGYITNAADEMGRIVYYFSSEKEATMFRLRWL